MDGFRERLLGAAEEAAIRERKLIEMRYLEQREREEEAAREIEAKAQFNREIPPLLNGIIRTIHETFGAGHQMVPGAQDFGPGWPNLSYRFVSISGKQLPDSVFVLALGARGVVTALIEGDFGVTSNMASGGNLLFRVPLSKLTNEYLEEAVFRYINRMLGNPPSQPVLID